MNYMTVFIQVLGPALMSIGKQMMDVCSILITST